MKIVILDGYCLNPGDLSWADFEALGQVSVYDRTPLDDVEERRAEGRITIERMPDGFEKT